MTTWTYDALGRITQETYPLGTATYAYDALSRRNSTTDRLGQRRDFTFDEETGQKWYNASATLVNTATMT